MGRDGGAGVGALVGIGLVLAATVVVGAFVARMVSAPSNPSAVSSETATPVYVPHGPPISLVASASARPPLSFNDPDNAERFEHAKGTVAALTQTVGAIASAKSDVAIDSATAACKASDKELSLLAGEPHVTVRELIDTEQRLCEYQRPLASLDVIVARIAAARKSSGKRPDAICKRAEEIAIEIHAGQYQDDPTMLRSLDSLGKLCV